MNCHSSNKIFSFETEIKGFRIHRTVYACVIALLAAINLTFTQEYIWVIFPMIGWGIGLMVHYMNMRKSVDNLKEQR